MRTLVAEGHQVTAVGLKVTTARSLADMDIEKHDVDIRDHQAMCQLLQDKDIVFHLASHVLRKITMVKCSQ